MPVPRWSLNVKFGLMFYNAVFKYTLFRYFLFKSIIFLHLNIEISRWLGAVRYTKGFKDRIFIVKACSFRVFLRIVLICLISIMQYIMLNILCIVIVVDINIKI